MPESSKESKMKRVLSIKYYGRYLYPRCQIKVAQFPVPRLTVRPICGSWLVYDDLTDVIRVTVSTGEQRNSRHRGTKEQRNSGHRGTVGTEER